MASPEPKQAYVEEMPDDLGIEHVAAEKRQDGTGTDAINAANLTPEMRELVGSAIQASFGRQENDSGQFEPDIEYIITRMAELSHADAVAILQRAVEEHDNDPNFPEHTLDLFRRLLGGPKAAGALDPETHEWTVRANAALVHFHSPYAEVRAVTDPYDDPSLPALTARAYFLGLAWMCISTVVNTFFTPRQPGISLGTQLIQLLIYPCGRVLEKALPDWGVTVMGRRHSLNPGRWSYKEQMLATIIVNIANGPGYIMNTYLVLKMPAFFGFPWVTLGFEMLLALSTQLLGLGYAGILRRVVVYNIKSIWPGVLPTLALNRALLLDQPKESINGWTISRYRFFLVCFLIMFCYFWIPNYLFTALHAFNWMTWIAPQNFNLATITGFYGGMGFNPIATFDWNVSMTGRLVTPAFSTIQQYMGSVLSGLIIIAMYYSNMYYSAYIPINSNDAFTNKATPYNVTKVLTDGHIDEAKYQEYGFGYYGAANIWGQGAWFAWYPMCLLYIGISQWVMIKQAYNTVVDSIKNRGRGIGFNDAHSRMMSAYKEVPDWWYLTILILALVFGIVGFQVYPLHVPVWTLFATVGICICFLIPMAILNSMANVSFAMNVFFQLLAGWWFPGNPVAMIMMMNFGYNMDAQAEAYISNQKMAHYAKVSPRGIFFGQVSAVVINCFVFVGMTNWMIGNFKGMCEWSQPEHFVCEAAHAVYSQTELYGVMGDRRTFSVYPILPYCFLFGGAAGLLIALAQKYGHKVRDAIVPPGEEGAPSKLTPVFHVLAMLKYFNPAAFWNGATNTWTGGYNLSYKTGGLYVSLAFMIYVKRRYTAWWQKYNYLIEAGFDIGVAVSAIVMTFALSWNKIQLKWWGNTISTAGIDFASYNQNGGLLPLPDVGYFGPAPGHNP